MFAVTSAETRSSAGACARRGQACDQAGQRLPGAEYLDDRLVEVVAQEFRIRNRTR